MESILDLESMKIAVIARMPHRLYSGGRLTTLNYAASLGSLGHDVSILTDNFPRMWKEYKHIKGVRLVVTDLKQIRDFRAYDAVILVPHMGNRETLSAWAEAVDRTEIVSALLNFETPNWFNSMATIQRDPSLWDGWLDVSETVDHIISLSSEGTKFAKDFYRQRGLQFSHVYPSINSRLADKVSGRRTNDTIAMLTRADYHKGLNFIESLIDPRLKGYSIRVHLGNGKIEESERIRLGKLAAANGLNLRIGGPIIGVRKFKLLASSKLLFFPTEFEGFGIPPLEAAYVGTPVLASDLPVLREFGERDFNYFSNAAPENVPDLVLEMAASCEVGQDGSRIRELAEFQRAGRDLMKILR